MSSTPKATFFSDIEIKGSLSGPAISALQTATQQVQTNLDNDRTALQTSITNVDTKFTSEVSRLDGLHTSDDARLTAVETELKNVDTDIQSKIDTQIAQHNTDIANLDPRVAKIESKFIIDDATMTISIPQGYTFKVLGDFQQGTESTESTESTPPPPPPPPPTAPPSGEFGNPEDLSSTIEFDSNMNPWHVLYNSKDYKYEFTSLTGPYADNADVLSKLTASGLTTPVVDRYVIVLDIGTQSNIQLVLVTHSGGNSAYILYP